MVCRAPRFRDGLGSGGGTSPQDFVAARPASRAEGLDREIREGGSTEEGPQGAREPGASGPHPDPGPDRHGGAGRRHVLLRHADAATGHRPGRRHQLHAGGPEPAGQAQRDQRDQHEHRRRHHGAAGQRSRCDRVRGPDAGQQPHHREHPQGDGREAGPPAGRHHRPARIPAGADHHRGRRRPPSPSPAPRRAARTARARATRPSGAPRTPAAEATHAVAEREADDAGPRGDGLAEEGALRQAHPLRQAQPSAPGAAGAPGRRGHPAGPPEAAQRAGLLHEGEAAPPRARRPPTPSRPTRSWPASKDGAQKYALGPVGVEGTDVKDAKAVFDSQQGQGWIVQMDFTSEGGKKFADITGKLAAKAPPQNQFAHRPGRRGRSPPRASTSGSTAVAPRSPAASPSSPPRTSATCCPTVPCRSPSRSTTRPRSPRRSAASSCTPV